jgi:hypothetical protein
MTAGIALAACASNPQSMTASARQELRADVGAIEQAAAAHQLQATATALAHLQSDIAQLEANGVLTTSAGTKVLRAAAAVQADIGWSIRPPPPPRRPQRLRRLRRLRPDQESTTVREAEMEGTGVEAIE